MSRGVRDLRELICVSRLTVRASDEEVVSDEEDLPELSHFIEHVSISVANSRQSSANSNKTSATVTSPDSGVVVSDFQEANKFADKQDASRNEHPVSATKKKRRKKGKASNGIAQFKPLHGSTELPRSQPLPPVASCTNSSRQSSNSSGEDSAVAVSMQAETNMTKRKVNKQTKKQTRTDFSEMLIYIDSSVTSEWLNRCNTCVAEMTKWCHQLDNFVQFAHFWLSSFPEGQKLDILHLEYSIIVDQLEFAFDAGIRQGRLTKTDISELMDAVFPEYYGKMHTSKGFFLFLDYLDVLTCEDKGRYRKLLSDVRCSTRIKQHVEWLLAVRALALVNIWSAIVNFYKNISSQETRKVDFQIPLSTIAKTNPHPDRMYHAIRNGYLDVINYLLKSNKIPADYCDSHQRSLVFTAVMHNQPDVLSYLVSEVKPRPDVNKPADTGNTPLHAAANKDDIVLVTTLLKAEGINVNPTNAQCDGATPLHLAVMHGYKNIVEVLLVAKADLSLKMGDQTAEDIAEAFGHEEILTILQNPEEILAL